MSPQVESQPGWSAFKVWLFLPHPQHTSLINDTSLVGLRVCRPWSCLGWGCFPTRSPAGSALGFVVPPKPFVRQDVRRGALTSQPGLSASWQGLPDSGLWVHDLTQWQWPHWSQWLCPGATQTRRLRGSRMGPLFIFQRLESASQLPTCFYLVKAALFWFFWSSRCLRTEKERNGFFCLSYLTCSLWQMAVPKTPVIQLLFSTYVGQLLVAYLTSIPPPSVPHLDFPRKRHGCSPLLKALALWVGTPPSHQGSGVQHMTQPKPSEASHSSDHGIGWRLDIAPPNPPTPGWKETFARTSQKSVWIAYQEGRH